MIKVGLVGGGYWGRVLLDKILAVPAMELSCLVDRNQTNREYFASRGLRVSSDYQEFLHNDPADLVIVATQAGYHNELAIQALEAKKHVLIEKPIATTSEQLTDLLQTAERVGQRVFEDQTFLFHPKFQKVKQLIADQSIGRTTHYYAMRADFGRFPTDINILWHLLYHDAYMLHHLFPGKIRVNHVEFGPNPVVAGLWDHAVVHCTTEENVHCTLTASMRFPVKKRLISVSGDHGGLYWEGLDSSDIVMNPSTAHFDQSRARVDYDLKPIATVPTAQQDALESMLSHVEASLQNNTKALNEASSSRDYIAFIEQCCLKGSQL